VPTASTLLRAGRLAPGARSSANRRRASWPATSSPWSRYGSPATTYSSSSRSSLDACTCAASRPTRRAGGSPSRPETSPPNWRRPGASFSHLLRDRDTKFTTAFGDVWRSNGAPVIRTPVRGAERERVRRALGRNCPPRMARPPPDRRPASSRPLARRLRPALQRPPASPIPQSSTTRTHDRGLPGQFYRPWGMCAVVMCSVASSTNMTWSRDVISFKHPTGI